MGATDPLLCFSSRLLNGLFGDHVRPHQAVCGRASSLETPGAGGEAHDATSSRTAEPDQGSPSSWRKDGVKGSTSRLGKELQQSLGRGYSDFGGPYCDQGGDEADRRRSQEGNELRSLGHPTDTAAVGDPTQAPHSPALRADGTGMTASRQEAVASALAPEHEDRGTMELGEERQIKEFLVLAAKLLLPQHLSPTDTLRGLASILQSNHDSLLKRLLSTLAEPLPRASRENGVPETTLSPRSSNADEDGEAAAASLEAILSDLEGFVKVGKFLQYGSGFGDFRDSEEAQPDAQARSRFVSHRSEERSPPRSPGADTGGTTEGPHCRAVEEDHSSAASRKVLGLAAFVQQERKAKRARRHSDAFCPRPEESDRETGRMSPEETARTRNEEADMRRRNVSSPSEEAMKDNDEREVFESWVSACAAELHMQRRRVLKLLRLSLTGRLEGPPLWKLVSCHADWPATDR